MNPVALSEIKNIAEYEMERQDLRPRMMALKERRRITVGGHFTFLFENRETVRYQVQEMMRIERMVAPQAIAYELLTYNELIPLAGELSATLLIEFDDPAERKFRLRDLLGLEDHIWIEVEGEPPSCARFDTRQIATDRISAVQYLKFPLTPEQRSRWHNGVRIVIDHPAYPAAHSLTPAQIEELKADFA